MHVVRLRETRHALPPLAPNLERQLAPSTERQFAPNLERQLALSIGARTSPGLPASNPTTRS